MSITPTSRAAQTSIRHATTNSSANSRLRDFAFIRFTEHPGIIEHLIAIGAGKGAFAEGIAPGVVLLFLALLMNGLLQYARGKGSINP